MVKRLFHVWMPVSYIGARCLRRLFEYLMGLHCCRTRVLYSLVPIVHRIVYRLSLRVSSTACETVLMLTTISLWTWSGGIFSSSRLFILLARRSMRSVGSFSRLDSRASIGQWLNWVRMRCVWHRARNPLSVPLFIVLIRCSMPIRVALSLSDGSPRPISFGGR